MPFKKFKKLSKWQISGNLNPSNQEDKLRMSTAHSTHEGDDSSQNFSQKM
jgi:hypothetical protein